MVGIEKGTTDIPETPVNDGSAGIAGSAAEGAGAVPLPAGLPAVAVPD